MNAAAAEASTVSTAPFRRLTGGWLSRWRKRVWVILLVFLYILGGFFGAPALVKKLAIDAARDHAGREATIDTVRINPYVLSVEINGFAVADPDGEKLAGFDRLFVNFQLSSLFRRAWTFREIRLEGLDYLIERYAPGDTRLARLLADVEKRADESAEDAEPAVHEKATGLPRFLVHQLSLDDGRVQFRDSVPAEPVDLEFGPVSVQELNTLPDRLGQQSVHFLLPNGSAVSWQGNIALGPLRSEGTFSLEGSHLEQTTIYLKAILPLQSLRATLSTRTRYRVEERADGSLAVELEGLEAKLSDVAVSGLTPATEFMAFQSLELLGGTLRYPENMLRFSTVRLSEPRIETWLDQQGQPNLLQLVPEKTPGTNEPGVAAEAAPEGAIATAAPPLQAMSPRGASGSTSSC